MRILVLGAGGMLGHKMFQTLRSRYPDTFGTLRGRIDQAPYAAIDLFQQGNVIEQVDAHDIPTLVRQLERLTPAVIVNCVGVIKQRKEANAAVPSITLNALLPHVLADTAQAWGGRVIHFSTDCVFDGTRGRYTEADASTAQDLYGQTKFLGEVATGNALTLRTSIIGRELSQFGSLLEWFLQQNGKRVSGYKRALYAGVTTNHLAHLVGELIEHHPNLCGLYQVASETISKYDLLALIRDAYGLDVEIIPDDLFACDRSLLGTKFQQDTGYQCPPWPELVAELAQDLTPYDSWRNPHEAVRR